MKSTKHTTSPTSSETKKPIKKAKEEDDGYEDAILVAYQKKGGGEWERVEIPYRKKKK